MNKIYVKRSDRYGVEPIYCYDATIIPRVGEKIDSPDGEHEVIAVTHELERYSESKKSHYYLNKVTLVVV